MATYLLLNILFVLVVIWLSRARPSKGFLIVALILFVLTAVFDSLLVSFHIIAYTRSEILGISIGNAPVEDFFYPLLAALIMPTLWRLVDDH